jgi:hypothetical protein
MRIERHDAHGEQLVVFLSQKEAVDLLEKLAKTTKLAMGTDITHCVELPCEFENDNDRLLAEIDKVELYRDNPVEGKRYRSLRAEWHALKAVCSHPNRKTKPQDFGGGTYTYCPDCHGIIATSPE